MSNKIKTLVGKKFGKLSVLERERRNRTTFYTCQCECGNSTTTTHSNLLSGQSKSCGCLIFETRGKERKPLEEVISNSILGTYKRNAKNRHYEWSLPYEKFVQLINGVCYYCKSVPSSLVTWRYKHEVSSLPFNGIDRLDNTIGYTANNCVSCCRTCNSAKGDLTVSEFKAWALKLAANF